MMDEALSSLSATLGDQPFLLGDRPYEADAAVFGMLHVLLHHKGAFPQLEEIVSGVGWLGLGGWGSRCA